MTHFQYKLMLLEQNYSKVRQTLYSQELLSKNKQILLVQDKTWENISYIHRSCSYCHETYRHYYANLYHQKGRTQLCLKCTYNLLMNQKLKCSLTTQNHQSFNNSRLNHKKFIKQKENRKKSQLFFRTSEVFNQDFMGIPKKKLKMDNLMYYQQNMQEELNIQKLQQYSTPEDPILFKLTHQYCQKQQHQILKIHKIQIITSNNIQANVMPEIFKLPAFKFMNQINLLSYFYKNIVSKALTKTYKQQDRISKGQIGYLYEIWIKYVKPYLQQKAGIQLRQCLQGEYKSKLQTKKLVQGDKKLSVLNTEQYEYYRGLVKNVKNWNQLVENLMNKRVFIERIPIQNLQTQLTLK